MTKFTKLLGGIIKIFTEMKIKIITTAQIRFRLRPLQTTNTVG